MIIRGIIGVALTVPWLATVEAQEANEPNPTEVEFRQMVAELRKAGEPTTPADLRSPPIAPEKNGATYLRKAFALTRKDDPRWKEILERDGPISAVDVDKFQVRDLLRDLPKIDENLEGAMACERVDWEINYASPFVDTQLPFLKDLRLLAHYLWLSATVHGLEDDHGAIIRRVHQIGFLARASHSPLIVSHLVSIGLDRYANRTIRHAPALRIGRGKTDARRDQLEAVIRELLNDSTSRGSLRRAYQGERIMQIDSTELVGTGKVKLTKLLGSSDEDTPGDRKIDALGRMLNHWVSGKALLEHSRKCLDVVAARDWVTAKTHLPQKIRFEGLTDMNKMLAATLCASADRLFRHHFLGVAERRLAATSLALQLYAFDHDGKLPATLNELVPKYLPAVPLDPMTDGQPIRYIAEKRMVYSVGRNEKDDGGVADQVNGELVSDDGDMVFRLPTRQ